MNFYDCLEIEKIASAGEIKKAYFRLVRRFTPEKAPEKFMQLRQAYEVLSDPERREAYNAHLETYSNSPKEITALVMEADTLTEKGLFTDAVNLLENSDYFRHDDIQAALCLLYLEVNKSGKAVKIAEQLVSGHPENAGYLRLVVKSYVQRGWGKKAQNAIKTLERLDPGNEDNSPALLLDKPEQFPFYLGMTVEAIEEKGKKAPMLCACILSNCLWGHKSDEDSARYQLLRLFADQSSEWDDPTFAAKKLAEHTCDISNDKKKKIREIIKTDILSSMFNEDNYGILPYIDNTIKNIQAEELFEFHRYKIAAAGYSALEAVRLGTPRELVILSLMRAWLDIGFVSEQLMNEYRDEVTISELEVISKFYLFLPHIRKFQKSLFYQHSSDFFEMILQSSEHKLENEFRRRITRTMKINTRLTMDWLGSSDLPDTPLHAAREEPIRVTKIGRNEPCPCGSGKKYKKCCGSA